MVILSAVRLRIIIIILLLRFVVQGGMEREEEGGKEAGWGFESPSLLNREVSSILSRASLPGPEDERHKAAVSPARSLVLVLVVW